MRRDSKTLLSANLFAFLYLAFFIGELRLLVVGIGFWYDGLFSVYHHMHSLPLAILSGIFSALLLLTALGAVTQLGFKLLSYMAKILLPQMWTTAQLLRVDSQPFDASNYEVPGYRFAHLQIDGFGKFRFTSLIRTCAFKAEEVATCSKPHAVPEKNCKCGFYSRKQASMLENYSMRPFLVLLRCYYTGKVIRGPRGHRAYKQHVLKAYLSATCVARGCGEPAVGVIFHDQSRTFRGSCCEMHSSGKNISYFSLADLRASLGCEFVFV